MSTYSFKSAGKTQDQVAAETLVTSSIPYGIKTPLQLGGSEGIFAMNYSLEDQFSDNLRNLLLTNWGERLGVYEFGANLKPLTTEFVSQDDFDGKAIDRIKGAVGTWMPFIDLEDFTSQMDRQENANTGVLKITVTYRIPALKTQKKALQIVLYVI
jgi:phage baseplate assembly protein W